jgi:hypothetical protein
MPRKLVSYHDLIGGTISIASSSSLTVEKDGHSYDVLLVDAPYDSGQEFEVWEEITVSEI